MKPKFRPAFLALLFVCSSLAAGEQLPRFGQLPDLGRDWKVRETGTNGTATSGWSWVIFTNSQTGDFMSVAAQKLDGVSSRKVNRIPWSDSAGEIFPAGHPVWPGMHPKVMVNWLRNEAVEISGSDPVTRQVIPKEALQYSIVFEGETKPSTNRLAHGYALAFGEFAVFVQHTSTKPITAEDAEGYATALISIHEKRMEIKK